MTSLLNKGKLYHTSVSFDDLRDNFLILKIMIMDYECRQLMVSRDKNSIAKFSL